MGFLGVFQLPGVNSEINQDNTCWLVAHTLMIKQPQDTPMKNSPNFQAPRPRGNRDFNSTPKIPWIISSSARGLPQSSHFRMRSISSFLGSVCKAMCQSINVRCYHGATGVKPLRYRPTNRLCANIGMAWWQYVHRHMHLLIVWVTLVDWWL